MTAYRPGTRIEYKLIDSEKETIILFRERTEDE